MVRTRQWGPAQSLLALVPLLIGLPWLALKHQYSLPTPIVDQYNPTTSLPQLSEATILQYAKYLSEDIGYRTPGTREHALADAWMTEKAYQLKEECERVVAAQPGRKLQCEVWRQEGSGSHRFDMMAARLYKHYVNLSNIIIRLSDGTDQGKVDAVLVNSHLDSTLPSPGAADDALAVGVMIECVRVLVDTPGWEPKHAVIFLFNNAEESLQDGSHLFSTQHPIASTSAGTTGPELLFQATSHEMIQAYSHVPRPYGTIFANEIFSSGVLLSDTDFRQFEYYLNVTGLDMAVVGNSYLYHMRGDLVENIEAGVAQHMAENTFALIEHLTSPASPLPGLASGYGRPRTVFFTYLGVFFVYSFRTAKVLYSLLFIASCVLVRSASGPSARGVTMAKALFSVVLGGLGALVGANAVAFMMQQVLGRGMSWFKGEFEPLILYGPAAMCGALITQLSLAPVPEKAILHAQLLAYAFLAVAGQFAGVGSSAVFFLSALSTFGALLVDRVTYYLSASSDNDAGIEMMHAAEKRDGDVKGAEDGRNKVDNSEANDGSVSLWTYALGQTIPLLTGTQLASATLVVFVPLTGRIGSEAPAEYIIASIVAILGSYTLNFTMPFVHRFDLPVLRKAVTILLLVVGVVMAVFARKEVFDRDHQKRLFVLHKEDLNTREQHLHIAAADGAPGFDDLVHDITAHFGASGMPPKAIVMDDWNSDWDTLYPFSAFLSPYKIDLPLDPAYDAPWPPEEQFTVSAVNDTFDESKGTRTMTLKIDHPGIMWTVIAFDAHVLEWTLDNNPPEEFARHHIKEASFYGTDVWTVDMTIKSSDVDGLRVDFIGIQEKRMWPAKKADADGHQAMKLFEEFDAWLDEKTGGSVDALFMGCVSGEVVV
ncbi:uncharacterized protein F5891DRAFT_1050672 [Suillus fuscotomentosus]|uniref:Peptide hydrolase n=1 Tax=Suillus fuscotomentosus TaxID=1912939 RepID=A0AAD4DZV8_9AGAM|nr:uncharacterized protein F5891DRAFT_1050672 [Suillus fuscotomentosus]KAG1897160.1 hypothetical protein F5891DRAFT_1050672 [Suillus fuscotomentosus]